jgi:hypothetical protein
MSMKVEDGPTINSAVFAVSQHPSVFELDLLVFPVCCHALSLQWLPFFLSIAGQLAHADGAGEREVLACW